MGAEAPILVSGSALRLRTNGVTNATDVLSLRRKVIWEQVTLPTWLRIRRPAFVHLPWYEGPARVDVPLIITIHDLDTLIHPTRYSQKFRAYYNELLLHYARIARRIITDSETSARDIAEFLAAGERTIVIPLAASPEFFSADRARGERLLKLLGVASGRPVMLSASGTGPRKNLETLVRALEIMAAQGHETSLVITQAATIPISLRRSLERAAGVGMQVLPVGALPVLDLAGLYAACDISISPSLYEGFGFSLVEAMAAGCPVVASSAGSHPEIAGDAALLFPATDAGALAEQMLAVLASPSLRAQMIRAGAVRARSYDWSRTVDLTRDVYREVSQ
jgi:alpha-1,3-rhamnosyl/mannosyltransferase